MKVAANWPFIGRQVELQRVLQACHDGRCVVIRGPAGIGKTRLLDEAVRRLDGSVHRVRAVSGLSGAPLGVFVPLIGESIGDGAVDNLRSLLTEAGGQSVLVVDDAHALDQASAGLVQQVVVHRWAPVVLATRSGAGLPVSLEGLWSEGVVEFIDIGPLDDESLHKILEDVLEGAIERGTRQRLLEASEGNVLYLRELLYASVSAGALVADNGIWRLRGQVAGGPTLEDLIRARLASLDLAERQAIECLAVAGEIPLEWAASLTEPGVLEHLEREAFVTTRCVNRCTHVDLAHPLHGEVVRRHLPRLALVRISRQLVQLAVEGGAIPHGYEARAARWVLDGDPMVSNLSGTQLEQLARRLLELGDPLLAAELGEAVFERDGLVSAAVLAAWCRGDHGDHLGAYALFERAASCAARVDSELRAGLEVELAGSRWWGRQDLAGAFEHLERARALGPDAAALADAQAAMFCVLDGRVAEAIASGEPLLRHHNDAVATVAAAALGPALAAASRPADAQRSASIGLERVVSAGLVLPSIAGAHLISMIFAKLIEGDLQGADELAEFVQAGAARQVSVQARAWASMSAAMVSLLAGRLDQAIELSSVADVLWRDAGVPAMARWAGAHGALAALDQGRPERARQIVARHRDARAEGFRLMEPRWSQVEARLAYAAGHVRAATAGLERAAFEAREAGSLHGAVECLHVFARWNARRPSARALMMVPGREVHSELDRIRLVHLDAVAGRRSAQLERVAQRFEATGILVHAYEAWEQAAAAFERDGRYRAASHARARASGCAEAAGLLSTRQPAVTCGLTGREREVAELAASGYANGEIAATLFIAERTVENHLYRAFTKLGVRSRKELRSAIDTALSSRTADH
ncbi:MAG: LuxR C-terminal-related transcriptional regulator [Acidimicrobiales bacterium]|nr:LuxR C-terminal-related transcriptional regulator [Acidimicrobiales bacterium]